LIIDKIRRLGKTLDTADDLSDNKNIWVYLGIPIFISLLIKLILLSVLFNSPINNDGTLYIHAAQQYAMGNFAEGLRLYPMPTYPLLLVLVHAIIPDWIFAGFFISLLSIVLVTIPLYYLTESMFNAKAGFWACMVLAVLPRMNYWSLDLMRDPLFLLLIISSIFFAQGAIVEKKYSFFMAAFVFAWSATLLRIEGVVFIAFYFIALLHAAVFNKENRSYYFSMLMIWAGIPIGIALLVLLSGGVRSMAVNRFDFVIRELIDLFSGGFLRRSSEIYQFLSDAGTRKPFFEGHYSFASLCKHFMPLIYMLGLVQIFVKILFPLSFIPLYAGIRDKTNSSGYSGKFILWTGVLFVGFSYYFLVKHDLIATRYLIVPAFLLLPWVGLGINRLWMNRNHFSHKKLVLFLIFIIIFVPTLKTFSLVKSKDTTTYRTIKWLVKNDKIGRVPIVVNDNIDSFYIDLAAEEKGDYIWKTYYHDKNKIAGSIEMFAKTKRAQLIILKVKKRHIDKIENFKAYKKIKSFAGNSYTTFIYSKAVEN